MRTYQRIFVLVVMLLGFFLALPAFFDADVVWDQENGPLENIQVILLFLGCIFFLVPIRKSERSVRCVLLAGAMLCLSFILRELDVEYLAVPQWVILIGSGSGRNIIMGTGWVILGVFTVKLLPEFKGKLKPIILSRTVILMVISALLLLSGELFDHERIQSEHAQLYEEVLETIGYFLLLIAAIASRGIAKIDPAKDASD